MRVAIVSTYPPRACGIGTFSRDLRDALLAADGVTAVDLVAIVRDEGVEQEPEVVVRILQDQGGDYARSVAPRGREVPEDPASRSNSLAQDVFGMSPSPPSQPHHRLLAAVAHYAE
jgi:hypothetical protein